MLLGSAKEWEIRVRDVSEFLRSTLAELLATTPGALSGSVQFRDQGLDSARALRWTQRIAERVGYPIQIGRAHV